MTIVKLVNTVKYSSILALRQTIDYHKSLFSQVYICYLDALKAFDRINHWIHFRNVLAIKVPTIAGRCWVLGIVLNYSLFNREWLTPKVFTSLMVYIREILSPLYLIRICIRMTSVPVLLILKLDVILIMYLWITCYMWMTLCCLHCFT